MGTYYLMEAGRDTRRRRSRKEGRKRRRCDERSASKSSRDPVVYRRPLCAREMFFLFSTLFSSSVSFCALIQGKDEFMDCTYDGHLQSATYLIARAHRRDHGFLVSSSTMYWTIARRISFSRYQAKWIWTTTRIDVH